jgi:protein-L-isoaspartate(D-aspartate) O-methyltransferase
LRDKPSQGKEAGMTRTAPLSPRQTMVDSQLKTVGVTDAAVLAAFADLPREAYLPAALAPLAYADAAHAVAPGRRLLPPLVLALLLQHAAVQPGQRVLVVGSATGLSAALLARMGAKVTALESDAALIASAESAGVASVQGPLAEGWSANAPYDVILFEGAIGQVPAAIAAQLAPGGRIAAVMREAGVGRAYAGPLRADGQPAGLPFLDVSAPDLPGFARPAAFAF